MASKRKNSLVNNINRRKRAGQSRAKSRSTVSKESYREMQQGWPNSSRKKQGANKKRTAKSKTGGKKRAKRGRASGRKK